MSKDWEEMEDWELDPRFNGAAELAKSEFETFKEAVKVIVKAPKQKKRKPKAKPKKTKKKGGK